MTPDLLALASGHLDDYQAALSLPHVSAADSAAIMSALQAQTDEGARTGSPAPALPSPGLHVSDADAAGAVTLSVRGVLVRNLSLVSRYFQANATDLDDLRHLADHLADQARAGNVSEVHLHLDSPGGSVAGLDDCAAALARLAAEVPLHARVVGLCASAAYRLAIECETITASPGAQLGSIGSRLAITDTSRAAHQAGVAVTEIASPNHKAQGPDGAEVPQHVYRNARARVEANADQFRVAVADRRPAWNSDDDQGDLYTADEALARGLIDAIATLPPAQATPAQGVDDLPPTPGGPSASTHQEADSMDNALLALVRDFPESFEDITAAADAGTDPAQLRATLESRRDEAERVAALAAAEAERDEAREALAAAEAERDEAREALAAAEAERDELKALNPGQPDPGADNTPANPQRRRDMTGAERNAFIVEHGISSYQALPY